MSSRNSKRGSSLPSSSKVRKIWYIISAIIFFLLVLLSLISSSYILSFLNQNPSCGVNTKSLKQTKSAAIATVVVSVFCLVAVIGFAALQVRRQRRLKQSEKNKAQGKKSSSKSKKTTKKKKENEDTDDETDDDDDEDEDDDTYKANREREAEVDISDPKKVDQLIQSLPVPTTTPPHPVLPFSTLPPLSLLPPEGLSTVPTPVT